MKSLHRSHEFFRFRLTNLCVSLNDQIVASNQFFLFVTLTLIIDERSNDSQHLSTLNGRRWTRRTNSFASLFTSDFGATISELCPRRFSNVRLISSISWAFSSFSSGVSSSVGWSSVDVNNLQETIVRLPSRWKLSFFTDSVIRIVFDNSLCIFRIVVLGDVWLLERISPCLCSSNNERMNSHLVSPWFIPPSFACWVDNVRT